MPELPEVETLVRELVAANLIGCEIIEARILWPRTIAAPLDPNLFCSQITHQIIEKITRRGKFIVFSLNTYTLLVHLRMTGKFTLTMKNGEPVAHERIQLHFKDGRVLHFHDQRKFGKWYLLSHPEDLLNNLGLEPLSEQFTLIAFQNLLKNLSLQAKSFLLNQQYVAGIGNIYADEVLWEAKIHPKKSIDTLSKKEIRALHLAIPKVLQNGIAHTGSKLGSKEANFYSVSGRRANDRHGLKVFRRHGQKCLRCHSEIIKIIVAQRSTHLCPHCQKF